MVITTKRERVSALFNRLNNLVLKVAFEYSELNLDSSQVDHFSTEIRKISSKRDSAERTEIDTLDNLSLAIIAEAKKKRGSFNSELNEYEKKITKIINALHAELG